MFDQSEDDGAVELLDADPPEQWHPAVRLAAGICPARAITVQEDSVREKQP